jgi:acyl-CoA thioesterase FadM
MSQYFTKTFRVRWSEGNAVGQVDLATYLRYLMETAWDWGASGGLTMAENERLGLAWIIRENELNLYRPLMPGDVFDFNIWLINWRRVRGTRGFELRLQDGDERAAEGVQQVTTLDSKTFRPVRFPDHLVERFLMDNPRVIQQQRFPKFQAQPEKAFVTQRKVEWRDLDLLEHVNNAVYADFTEQAAAQALAAAGWSPSHRRFHIQYQSPALWGDTLNVAAHLVELEPAGGTWYIAVERPSDSQSIVKCVLEWALVDRVSGEEKTLPESLFYALNEMLILQ